MNAFLLAFGVIGCYVCSASSAAAVADDSSQRRDAAMLDPYGPVAAEIDSAADTSKDDKKNDREKRQLSSVQNKLLNFLKPLPVVDVTKEEDKYGNDGDKFNRFGRSFINGLEKVSSVLTSTLSFPVDTAKKLSRSATEKLNNLGGRLVGLQR